jgi:large subunit ribosomal protein L6
MSRIGRLPVQIPDSVKVNLAGRNVKVEGPKGKLEWNLPEVVSAKIEDKKVLLTIEGADRKSKSLYGLSRALVANMVLGAKEGFVKKLEIQGVGFKASVKGQDVNLNLGFSHPVVYQVASGVTVTVTDAAGKKVPEGTFLTIEGADKQLVGAVAADIRRYYPPEPYKGKGVRFVGEKIIRKEGKTAQSK